MPFANLVMPFRVMREILFGSVPHGQDDTPTAAVLWPGYLRWWWGVWLAQGVLGRIAQSSINSATDIPSIMAACTTSTVHDIVMIIAAVLAMGVVRGITRLQDARYETVTWEPIELSGRAPA